MAISMISGPVPVPENQNGANPCRWSLQLYLKKPIYSKFKYVYIVIPWRFFDKSKINFSLAYSTV